MKRLLLILASLAAIAAGGDYPVKLTATVLGVSGENVSDTPVTDPIDMWSATMSNQISVTWTLTAGTTTAVTMGCSQAETNTATAYAPVLLCDGSVPSICWPDVRSITLSSFTASGGTYALSGDWKITKQYAKCYVAGSGTGVVDATGTRSWQGVSVAPAGSAPFERACTPLAGAPTRLQCTTSTDADSGALTANKLFRYDCDTDAWFAWGTSAVTAVANGHKVRAGIPEYFPTVDGLVHASCLSVTSNGDCRLSECR